LQATPEVHALVLWANAREREAQILEDVRSNFRLLDAVSVEWSRERFSQNLSRFYGDSLPDRSEKEEHCGTGPLLVLVLEDEAPSYGRRMTTRGRTEVVNKRVFAARARYRRWTGDGHRVHGTLTRKEAARDLFLLLGEVAGDCVDRPDWDGRIEERRTDLLGATGWQDDAELLKAIELTCGYVRLPAATEGSLTLLTTDRWWAALIADPPGDPWAARHEVRVGDETRDVVLSEVGDGLLDESWQRALLADAVREHGVFVPPRSELFYLLLARLLERGAPATPGEVDELDRLASEAGLAPLETAGPAELEARLHEHTGGFGRRRRMLRRAEKPRQ
jgi:hypothetical protein